MFSNADIARPRYSGALAASAAAHGLIAIAVIVGVRLGIADDRLRTSEEPREESSLVWLVSPQRGRGGGGGGDDDPRPVRELKLRGRERTSVPAPRPQSMASKARDDERRVSRIDIPAVALASALEDLPGTLMARASVDASVGPGRLGGAGDGRGGGIGPGRGPGLEAGEGGNAGGGPRRPGGPVTEPVLVRETKPAYTLEAMRAGIEGLVVIDAVVQADGSIGPVQIVRSLDSRLGLDQRALEAVREWRFRPSVMGGRPVASLVRIELMFTLR